jgi:hypothetical protein
MSIFRRPLTWIVLALACVSAAFVAYRYFPRAFPLVALDIRMDRERALRSARELAAARDIGPASARQAASFGSAQDVQTFVELEGGGKEAFARLLREGLYSPYTWRVRHFKERETHEATFRFRPDGQPVGFAEKIREDAPGAALPGDWARAIAEDAAASAWQVRFAPLALVEQSQERRPAGRVDHTFAYERSDRRLGDGRYRLRLVVTGHRLTELTWFIKIPEGFSRRYDEMRAANSAIGIGSGIATLLLYGIGGVALGIFMLLRRRALLWRPALEAAIVIAALQWLAILNGWPLAWMGYDTAIAAREFALDFFARSLLAFVALTGMLALTFMAAEGLTRLAFGHHPQLWRLWRREAAASAEIAGRVVAGYLLVGLFFAYEVALYFAATRKLGWWTPSEALMHPDVLAYYAPWLAAIAPSLMAGVWEECLFRAVPLAGAALIGDRFGNRRLWIGAAMIVQAIVFGAGHAEYPTQPAYARAVELIIPSFFFGAIYLQYGLLPGIVLHYAFDVVWFALPLFVADAPGVIAQRVVVILLTLVPLLVVAWQRYRARSWTTLPDDLRNAAWTPPEAAPPAVVVARLVEPIAAHRHTARVIVAIGIVAAVAWLATATFRSPVPPLWITAERAAAIARDTLARQGFTPDAKWHVLPVAEAEAGPGHRFVWRVGGRRLYEALLGTYLPVPRWRVRVITFEGPVADRAEEWTVIISGAGEVRRVRHQLPEGRAGANVTEAAAREIAQRSARKWFGVPAERLREISVSPAKRPARTDWAFTFADRAAPKLPTGEARISVGVAGDQEADAYRFVHIPEQWERDQRRGELFRTIGRMVSGVAATALVLGGAIAGLISWSRRRFSTRVFLVTLVAVLVVSIAQAANDWPRTLARFSTAQPWPLQLMMLGLVPMVMAPIGAAFMGLVAGYAVQYAPASSRHGVSAGPPERRWTFLKGGAPPPPGALGVALGAASAGIAAVGPALVRTAPRAWPSYDGASTFLPAAAPLLQSLDTVISGVAVLLLVVALVDRWTDGWRDRRVMGTMLFATFGFGFGAMPALQAGVVPWLIAGLTATVLFQVLYVWVLRFDVAVLPVMLATIEVFKLVQHAIRRPYPGSVVGDILAALASAALAWLMLRLWDRVRIHTPEAEPVQTPAGL